MPTPTFAAFLPFLTAAFLLAPAAVASAAEHPCRTIAKSCKSQGYSKGGSRSSGQGLVKDCLEKVVSGQTLAGIRVSFDTVSSCKSLWKARASSQQASATKARARRQMTAQDLSVRPSTSLDAEGFAERGPSRTPASRGAVR